MPALSSSQMSQLVLSSLDSESRNLIPREYPINIGFRFIECESLGLQSNMVAARPASFLGNPHLLGHVTASQ